MKKLLVPVLTTLATLMSAGSAQANWFGDDCVLRAQWAMFYPPEPAFLPTSGARPCSIAPARRKLRAISRPPAPK